MLFTIGKHLIGAYIGRSGVASGFGSAGSLVVVLLWVYFSAQILLLGAEFTYVYAQMYGSLASKSEDGTAKLEGKGNSDAQKSAADDAQTETQTT